MSEPRFRCAVSIRLLLVISLALAGCAPTLVSIQSFRSHLSPPEVLLEDLELANGGEPLSKADVLDLLGPPLHVIGQGAGEIFVYRRLARDSRTVTLNPAHVAPSVPSVPIYSSTSITSRDDLLMVFFDKEGAVRSLSSYEGVDD
jgi:hypothetical protein